MEVRTKSRADGTFQNESYLDHDTLARLETLLAINSSVAREKALFLTEQERLEAAIMANPVPAAKTYSYFGLMIGAMTPSTILLRFLWDSGGIRPDSAWILVLAVLTILSSAFSGYFTGKLVGRSVAYLHDLPMSNSLLLLPFLGIVWGMAVGAAGGVFFFLIGALFGGAIGGAVGAVALPIFAILHRLVKRGEMIEMQHFLPIAFGVTLTICSLILGL